MVGIFKRKTENEKLFIRYKKTQNEAFILPKIDRRKSDEKEKEANDILDTINKIEKTER